MAYIPLEFNTESGRYHITSHGNGWAYEIYDNETGLDLWFQDNDADTIRIESLDFEKESIISMYFDCIGE